MYTLNRRTLLEVYLILNKLGENYINKIPENIYNFIIQNKENQSLSNFTVSREAIAFIATLHYQYWVNSYEEKNELYNIFWRNEEKRKEKIKPAQIKQELFKKEEKNLVPIKDIEKNNKWYTKFINFIKHVFLRK